MIQVFISMTLTFFIGLWLGKVCRGLNGFVAWILAIPVSIIAGAVCWFVAEMVVAYCVGQMSDTSAFSMTPATAQALMRHFLIACFTFLWGFKSGRKQEEPAKQDIIPTPNSEQSIPPEATDKNSLSMVDRLRELSKNDNH